MNTHSAERLSFPALLAGLYPFFFLGPLMVWLAYPYPYPAWRTAAGFQTALAVLGLLPIAVGFAVGWLKRFPTWSYAYLFLAAALLILGGAELLDGPVDWQLYGHFVAGFALIAGLLILLVYISRRDLPLRDLAATARSDWTRLSLGLLIVPAAFSGTIDHSEDPRLTIFVIGPAIVLLLAALLGLLARSKQQRGWIILGGMLLALVVRLAGGSLYFLFYWPLLALLVFAPYLIDRSTRRSQVEPAE